MIALLPVFQPAPGLAFWSVFIFITFWLLVRYFAFGPIVQALEKRENDIQHSLDSAKVAREEISNMKADNEKLLIKAQEERNHILQEAKDMKNQIINEAKEKAKVEATKIISTAKIEIDNQTKVAVQEAKSKIGGMAIDIAEKLVKKELKGNSEHQSFVTGLVKDLNLN